MPSLCTSLLVIGLMVCAAVRAASVQTEVVMSWPTLAPVPAYTIKTMLNPQFPSRNGNSPEATTRISLTPCAQAILGCCVPEVKNIQECFDQIGCGPHVFGDPCEKNFKQQALGGAERFYNQFLPTTNGN